MLYNMNTVNFILHKHFTKTLPGRAKMCSRSSTISTLSDEHHDLTPVEAHRPVVGGRLNKGLNRLVKVLERRVDRQIMAAQIQAYDNSSETDHEPRYKQTVSA
jgi:hypothetical protein